MEPRPIQPNPETQLQVVQPTPIQAAPRGPRLGLPTQAELSALMAYGEVMIKSGMAPAHIKTAEAALVVMRYGHQLGIDEFTALQNMYVIGGKPAAFAGLLHSLILRDHGGGAIAVREFTAERVTIECRRRDTGQTATVSYTFKEAEQAGITKTNPQWAKYPADMLFARCISRAGRQLFRDSTMGMYVPEELGGNAIEVNGEVVEYRQIAGDDAGENGGADPDDDGRLRRAMSRLHALGAERNVTHEQLHDLAVARFDVPSMTDCSLEQLTELGTALKACNADQALDLVTVAQAVSEASDDAYLYHVASETAVSTLPEEAKAVLLATIERVRGRIAA